MSLIFSAAELDALERAQTALLSPLEYPTCEAWREDATARVARVLGADQAVFTLPRTTVGAAPPDRQEYHDEGDGAACRAPNTWMTETSLRRRFEVCQRDHLFQATRGATEICVGWTLRNQLLEMDGTAFDPFPGELFACLHGAHDHDRRPADCASTGAFAVRGLSYSLRHSMYQYGIGVSVVHAGLVKSYIYASDAVRRGGL